ncbi:hypothetical protein BGZ99_006913 [Dissophora globulifera]|uniref:heme oxygenase (biliverdin-producing) n=1 Tax=Dissophora globulifera TaxID=979702 RepID=A0A9P6RAZ6_9FUNG|nr:hypothetical protein BGZ99_006913 [Dissophora globulifera]
MTADQPMGLLAVDLREGTKDIHVMAERSKFFKCFFKGTVTPALYGRVLISLHHVYSALERILEKHKNDPNIELIYFREELSRKQGLEEDLEFFNGPDWRAMLSTITPAQQSYVDAIERCSRMDKPELLVAHAYVRYLGDLSGGQMLAKKLQKNNALPEGKGVAFYQFDKIEDKSAFKELFRIRLNQVEVDKETYREIIQEARQAFAKTIELFQEFDHELEDLSSSQTPSLLLSSPLPSPSLSVGGVSMEKTEMKGLTKEGDRTFKLQPASAGLNSLFLAVAGVSRASDLLLSFVPVNLIRSFATAVGIV